MKKHLLFLVALIVATFTVKAQTGIDNNEFGVGFDASAIKGFTNVKKQNWHPAVAISGIYDAYLPIAAELQFGRLSGGSPNPAIDPYGRAYTNNYIAFLVHADFQLSSVVDFQNSDFLNAVKGFYVGAGGGLIFNNNHVQRYNSFTGNGYEEGTYKFPGKDKSVSPMVTLRFGYEFKSFDSYQQETYAIDLGYVHNYAFGEGLDGYNDPAPFHNFHADQYGQFVIGIKYFFQKNYMP
jgi:hypothetical protein